MNIFDDLAAFPRSPYHFSPKPTHTPYTVEWRGPRMPPAATNVDWPLCQLDGDEWARLTPQDWLAMYPDDYWRESGSLGLVVLTHVIAENANPRKALESKYDAGGADLFARGLLSIVQNINKDLPPKIWSLRIASGMYDRPRKHKTHTVDWDRMEEMAGCRPANATVAEILSACNSTTKNAQGQVWRSLTDFTEAWQEASAAEQEARTQAAWESCLSDDRRRQIFALKARGLTESEIGAEIGMSRPQVKRIVDAAYREVCAALGEEPTPRKTRATPPPPDPLPPPFPAREDVRLGELDRRVLRLLDARELTVGEIATRLGLDHCQVVAIKRRTSGLARGATGQPDQQRRAA
jgi:DNA-directed RNA polymerase specialized sigma24 family protein